MDLDNDKGHEKVVDCVTKHLIESVQQVDQHVSDNVATYYKYNICIATLLVINVNLYCTLYRIVQTFDGHWGKF